MGRAWLGVIAVLAACNVDGLPAGDVDMAVNVDMSGARDLSRPPPDLTRLADLAPRADLAGDGGAFAFPDVIPGIWLIGWSGQIEHYSWMRFDAGGVMRIREPDNGSGWTGFFSCAGTGKWALSNLTNTIQVFMPAGCNPAAFDLTLASQWPKSGWGALATFDVVITTPNQMSNIAGFKFPDTQCAPDFSACTLPQ